MSQSHSGSPGWRFHCFTGGRSLLLQRHPVVTPIILLGSALLLGLAAIFPDNLFPILAFIGISSVPLYPLYLSTAFVLGISGILIGIIGIIESIDRYSLRAAVFAKPKEHSYANRN